MTAEIFQLRLTPERPVPGEPVLVEVLDANNDLIDQPDVVINGIRGARQYLQFDSVGDYALRAAAGVPGNLSAGSNTLTVQTGADLSSPRGAI